MTGMGMVFKFDARGFPETVIHPRYIFKYVSRSANTVSALSDSYVWSTLRFQ
jgi:hypothetical protein